MKKKKHQLVKPVCCMFLWPAGKAIVVPALNWNVNSSCRKIFAFLIAELTSQLYTVNLKLLFHYLLSRKLSLRCSYPHTCCLITIISFSKWGLYSNQHDEFSLTGKHNVPIHDLTSQQIDNVQDTGSNQTHRDKSLSHTHMHCTYYPPLHTCPPMTRAQFTQPTRSCLHITWQK